MKYLTILFLAFFTLSSCKQNLNANSASCSLELPVYGNVEKKDYSFGKGKVDGIMYQVVEPFPSKNVLNFYDDFFRNAGFSPFVEEYNKEEDREWQIFLDSTKTNKPIVAQLNASWANEESKKRANLVLRYYWELSPPRFSDLPVNNKLFVDVQVMPLVRIPPPPKM